MASFAVEKMWLISSILLFISSIYDVYRDLYFWDFSVTSYVKRVYKDWHVVKAISLTLLVLSAMCLDTSSILRILGWLLIRYGAFELGMNVISKEYEHGFMRLSLPVSLVFVLVGFMFGLIEI